MEYFRGMNYWKPYLLILALLSVFTAARAQVSHLVTHYSRKEYAAGNQNWSIDTDKQGFLYVGNNNGLLVYDGVHWKLFQVPGQLVVRSVLVADDGRIYTGSFEEFGYWDKDETSGLAYHSLKNLLKNYRFHNEEIWKIVQSGNKIYFQSFSSLFVYDHKTVRPVPLQGNIVFLLKAGNKMFLQNVLGALYEVVNDELKKLESGDILNGTEVKTVIPFGENTFLIGTTSSGVFIYDGHKITPWETPANELLKQYQINNGLVLGSKIIFGTIVKGIVILDMQGDLVDNLHGDNALQDNTVLALCSDKRGNVWVGLDRGIDYVAFNQPLDLYLQEGGQSGAVYTAALSGDVLYVGTNRGISLYRKSGDRYMFSGLLPGSQGQVWELKIIDGQLFCGHTNGTYLIKDNKMIRISGVNGGFSLQKFIFQGKEYLIQTTYSSLVLFSKESDTWKFKCEIHGYIEPSWYLEPDHLGNFWIGHSINGLLQVRLNQTLDSVASINRYGIDKGLDAENKVGVFKVGSRVVFTTGKKIYTWDDLQSKLIPYIQLNNQLNEFAAARRIIPVSHDRYWFLRQNDLALFELKAGKAAMLFRLVLDEYQVHMVETAENLIPLNDTEHLLCLDNGFAILRAGMIPALSREVFKPAFREILSSNVSGDNRAVIPGTKPIKIPHAYNSLSISFTSEGRPLERHLYQWRLAKIDTAWSNWSTVNDINYTRLPEGDYKFQVRVLLPSGIPSESIQFQFSIKPPWYASLMAFVLYGIAVIGVLLISLHLNRRRINRHHERLRQESIAKALLEKKQAEQEIITLQNQNLESEISHKNIQLADATISILKKNELLIEIKAELERQKEALGNRYPLRYFDRINSLIHRNISSDKDWQTFEALFDQAHQNFFKRLKTTYPELTPSDLKLCAYLRLNLSSKEIAPLLNISLRGVEIRRYRLRKRLALSSDDNLVEFIMQF